MALPAGTTVINGFALTPDGALYVTTDPVSPFTAATITATTKFLAADGTAAAPSYAFTDQAGTGFYRAGSFIIGVAFNGTPFYALDANSNTLRLASGQALGWANTTNAVTGTTDAVVIRDGANSLRFAGTNVTTTSRTEINKAVTAFSNTVAKTVFTVTIPNAAHHATIELRVQGALGAGGAIGAGEAAATNTYVIGIVRTAGVATVATATAAFGAVAVAVAGAATVTATAAVTAMSGAVGATQTFDIQVTITRSGGSSDNHTCLAYAKLLNANATGITIA